VRGRVDSERAAGDNDRSRTGDGLRKLVTELRRSRIGVARPDDRHRARRFESPTADAQRRRRIA
jgi:hypothetical protein